MDSWICPHPPDGQSLNAKPMKLPLRLGLQGNGMVGMIPSANIYNATNGFPWVEDTKADQVKEPCGWSYCLPRYRQGLCTETGLVLNEKIVNVPAKVPNSVCDKTGDASMPSSVPGCAPKRFLVFDHTGDKTTLIVSPGIGTPMQCPPTCWTPKPNVGCYLNAEELGLRRDVNNSPGPNLTEELNEEEQGTNNESEMHEDTDEINALLYSDNDRSDYSKEDEEETSTGHSPSTMTSFEEEGMEEVASSVGPTKRQRLSDPLSHMQLLYNTEHSSLRRESCADYEDDAQSSCGAGGNITISYDDDDDVDDLCSSLSGRKRPRNEKIRETVNILQRLIPGGKGKDAIMVIDEAIHYLRSLKHKAESLGLSEM